MIISHKHRFIFIKTRKTAGTSIEVFLAQYCDDNDIITPITDGDDDKHTSQNYVGYNNPVSEIRFHLQNKGNKKTFRIVRKSLSRFMHRRRFYSHVPAHLVKSRVSSEVWNTYFKFCVERNPWDKALSHYYWKKARSGKDLTFSEYIKYGACLNYPLYTDPYSRYPIVDKVIRYENLNNELASVFESLGIQFTGSLGSRAKGEYRKDTRSYREVFAGENMAAYIEVIRKRYEKEIEIHNYEF